MKKTVLLFIVLLFPVCLLFAQAVNERIVPLPKDFNSVKTDILQILANRAKAMQLYAGGSANPEETLSVNASEGSSAEQELQNAHSAMTGQTATAPEQSEPDMAVPVREMPEQAMHERSAPVEAESSGAALEQTDTGPIEKAIYVFFIKQGSDPDKNSEDKNSEDKNAEYKNTANENMQQNSRSSSFKASHSLFVGGGYGLQSVNVQGSVRGISKYGWGIRCAYKYTYAPRAYAVADLAFGMFSYENHGYSKPYIVVSFMPKLGINIPLANRLFLEFDTGIGADFRVFDIQRGVFPAVGAGVNLVFGLNAKTALALYADGKAALQNFSNNTDLELDVYAQFGIGAIFSF